MLSLSALGLRCISLLSAIARRPAQDDGANVLPVLAACADTPEELAMD